MPRMFEKELKAAKEAALKAGEVIMEVYATDFSVSHKSPEQPVTEADRRANEVIRSTLQEYFHFDGWI